MSKETFEELSVEEFDDLIENFINQGDDRIVRGCQSHSLPRAASTRGL